uniref:CRAL-TRIO domain-containing protein n=1 Tax=Echinostoma caproni TaxID=27848 RepID=A0A183BDU4_9TREM
LTYCVPVVRAAAKFLGVWLPQVLVERLLLAGPFLASLPQRDTLGEFSGPYQLKLNGLFGTLPPPSYEEPVCLAALRRLRLQHDVEQGEEVKEIEDGTDDDRSLLADSSVTTSATILSTVSDFSPSFGVRHSPEWLPVPTISLSDPEPETAQPDNWEVVDDGTDVLPLNTDPTSALPTGETWTNSLSKLWRPIFNRLGSNTELEAHGEEEVK